MLSVSVARRFCAVCGNTDPSQQIQSHRGGENRWGKLDEEYPPVYTTATGALKMNGISSLWLGAALYVRLAQFQDARLGPDDQEGPPKDVKHGPVLDDCLFRKCLLCSVIRSLETAWSLCCIRGRAVLSLWSSSDADDGPGAGGV
ncbi:hypothetical protein A1O7_03346 [Cladophialophora yegresii CBS 114405]|uniref:Uncharacterized protein n=1 Tax=Cladophialophora yegresii CBS 114405 TaxID=1182544 RepID=W9W4N1_9EURO|nr:uncharacterized protein A1O7_03346 [Cladophialophora yegresii CBS 114405]EXJ62903.1 hypothetical protein A1O7_03346 [Cladophialophora yegresii CBS 114405]